MLNPTVFSWRQDGEIPWNDWLVVFRPTPLKNDGLRLMTFPIYGKIKFMFQTTNQILWFSYGFPMVFLWFSYGFPVIVLFSGSRTWQPIPQRNLCVSFMPCSKEEPWLGRWYLDPLVPYRICQQRDINQLSPKTDTHICSYPCCMIIGW